MSEGIETLQKPTLVPRVLHYLHENIEATISDMIAHGMNRKTAESSLHKLEDIGLVSFTERSTFPRFRKVYHLTERGKRIVPYLFHLEKNLRSCSGNEVGCISEVPKGCLPVLVHMFKNPSVGVFGIIKDLGISPSQVYICLKHMVKKGILLCERREASKRIIATYKLTDKGFHVAIAAESLDGALRQS